MPKKYQVRAAQKYYSELAALQIKRRSSVFLGQCAECAFRESRRAYSENAVEAGLVVLPGNGGRQLDELWFVQVFTQALGEFAGDFRRRPGHRHGEVERGAFEIVKCVAALVL